MRYGNEPGVLRRFWWSGTQKRRLVVACSATLLSLAATSLAVIGGGQVPFTPAVAARVTPTTTTPKPVDPSVEVRTVSAVDQFDGVDAASGASIRVRVVGIRSTAPCWQAESLDFARNALLDKKVRLVVSTSGRTPDGRLPAHVRLPEGEDFALTALTAGAVLAGAEVSPELLAAESDARANHRGLWANACASSQVQSPSSTSEPATSTTAASPTRQPDESTAPTSVPTNPTTTTPPTDVQQGVQVGKPCSPEGAHGISRNGRDVTCKPTLVRGLRWAAE